MKIFGVFLLPIFYGYLSSGCIKGQSVNEAQSSENQEGTCALSGIFEHQPDCLRKIIEFLGDRDLVRMEVLEKKLGKYAYEQLYARAKATVPISVQDELWAKYQRVLGNLGFDGKNREDPGFRNQLVKIYIDYVRTIFQTTPQYLPSLSLHNLPNTLIKVGNARIGFLENRNGKNWIKVFDPDTSKMIAQCSFEGLTIDPKSLRPYDNSGIVFGTKDGSWYLCTGSNSIKIPVPLSGVMVDNPSKIGWYYLSKKILYKIVFNESKKSFEVLEFNANHEYYGQVTRLHNFGMAGLLALIENKDRVSAFTIPQDTRSDPIPYFFNTKKLQITNIDGSFRQLKFGRNGIAWIVTGNYHSDTQDLVLSVNAYELASGKVRRRMSEVLPVNGAVSDLTQVRGAPVEIIELEKNRVMVTISLPLQNKTSVRLYDGLNLDSLSLVDSSISEMLSEKSEGFLYRQHTIGHSKTVSIVRVLGSGALVETGGNFPYNRCEWTASFENQTLGTKIFIDDQIVSIHSVWPKLLKNALTRI